MVSRRLLRIKVMQTLYAFQINSGTTLPAQKKNLRTNIKVVHTSFITMIYALREIVNYVNIQETIISEKFIKKDTDKVDKSILENPLVKHFNSNELLASLFKKYKPQDVLDQDQVRKLYRDLNEREEYKAYLLNKDKTVEDERKILRVLFKKVMLKSDTLLSYFEEKFLTWDDDRNTVINMVIATINEFFIHKNMDFDESLPDVNWTDLEQFSEELFVTTNKKKKELDIEIEPMLENWEIERVNIVDLILVRMALAELLYFNHIPVKVTLNEYVEVAKVYSTPKSREFINGILDKLMKKLDAEKKIQKSGRGLME